MTLDLTSFQNAIAQLEEAISYCNSDLARSDARLALHLRAAAIQAFEFTYELSHKMLKRHLEATEASIAMVEELSFNDLIRRGYALGLLQAELVDWKAFRKNRGTTSHTYEEAKARDVYDGIPRFLVEAKFLLAQLISRQGD
jgi:nucleotidyltransferase substrate binding protein (TIGR01987 family)